MRGTGTPGREDGVGGGGVGGCGVGWSLREPVNEEAGLGDIAEGGCEGGVVACDEAPGDEAAAEDFAGAVLAVGERA